jgi:hypothetical protein
MKAGIHVSSYQPTAAYAIALFLAASAVAVNQIILHFMLDLAVRTMIVKINLSIRDYIVVSVVERFQYVLFSI